MTSRLLAYPITPADAQGRVDVAALRSLVRRLVVAKVDGIGLLGSTGSYPYLTRAERRRAIDAALDEIGGALPVQVGVGALRTDEAVALAQDAKAAGAAAGLLAPVSYIPLSDDEVFVHFEAVARVGLPLCIYNNPAATHFTVSTALTARLGALPHIVAVKNPAPASGAAEAIAALRAATPAGFDLGFSVDANATEAMIAGGDAWHSVLAGLLPDPGVAIMTAVRAGDAAKARRLNDRLKPLWALFTEFGGLRVVYAAADILGLSHAEPPRPILPLGDDARRRIGEAIEALSEGA
jgi:4-hydroxy-tetrahydrodipicolinate synthase